MALYLDGKKFGNYFAIEIDSHIVPTGSGNFQLWDTAGDVLFDFSKSRTAGLVTFSGGTTAGDDLRIQSGTGDTYPFLEMAGGSTTRLALTAGQSFIVDEEASTFASFNKSAVTFTTDATSTAAWTFNANTITSGTGIQIIADSDILTTGKIVDVLNGSSSNLSVFSISDTEVAFNDGSQDIDFRIETTNNANMFKVDGQFDFIQMGLTTGGEGYGETIYEGEDVSTSDATVTTIDSIGTITDSSNHVVAFVSGITSDGATAGSYHIEGTFNNDSGTVTQVGSTTQVHAAEEDATWGGATFAVSSNNILVKVTGKAATNIDWTVLVKSYTRST